MHSSNKLTFFGPKFYIVGQILLERAQLRQNSMPHLWQLEGGFGGLYLHKNGFLN